MGSAVDTLTTGSSAAPSSPLKRNAVAHETAVDVTGAKPGLDVGKRELFAESTSSVLVFENGGVIRLSAAVAAGQLLFLTDTQTKREVVAQVTRKHALGNGYVEVEFTEPAPGFWGVDFPSQSETEQKRCVESAPAAALREAVERADQESPSASPAPNAAEVERLKSEVEALRSQLESIQQQPSRPPSQPETSAPTPPWVAKKAQEAASEAAEVAGHLATVNRSERAADPAEPDREFVAQDLLPKAALDFSRADAAIALAPKMPTPAQSRQSNAAASKMRLVLLAGLFLAILGGALYPGWIPGLSRAKAQPAAAARITVPPLSKPNALANASKASSVPSVSNSAAATPAPAPNRSKEVTRGVENLGDAPPVPKTDPQADSDSEALHRAEESANPSPRPANPHTDTPLARSERSLNKKRDAPEASQEIVEPEAASEGEDGVVPPKLVHSVRAVAPPEAVRQFVTGNVILDAIVDTAGHVKSSKVLSGPPSLRNAAVEALKQYKYTPAKRHGKPVPAHLQVTVQFWYEP